MVIKERLAALGGKWKWVSSERQFSDGMTKISARQLLADRLRLGKIQLLHDPTFTAAKKKDAGDRNVSERAMAMSRTKF